MYVFDAVHNKENIDPIGEINKTSEKQEISTTSFLHGPASEDNTVLPAMDALTATFKDEGN